MLGDLGYGYGYGYGFEPTYVLVLIGVVITMFASARLKSTFARYSAERSVSGMTGADVARAILKANGIYDVTVNHVPGSLTDHYNPGNKTVNLSDSIYDSYSIAALGVAAHECGHAIQHNVGYGPLNFRSAFAPVANIGNQLSLPIIMIGLIFGIGGSFLIQLGIYLFLLTVLFQLITLPVEYNASSRALAALRDGNILPTEEERKARKVLNAAALTYVAGAAASVLQLLRLILLSRGRRRD